MAKIRYSKVFDLSELRPGCIVFMNADVKADISLPGVFKDTTHAE